MNKQSIPRFLVAFLFAAFAVVTLALADLGTLAQNTNSSTTGDDSAQNANTNTAAAAQDDDTPRDLSGERADLSGTYTGYLTMSGGHEMSGEATLTITGNTFQLEGGGMTHGGRVYAVTTRGYIGAAFYFTDLKDPTTNTPVVANVRARKRGESLTLSPVPNASTRVTFGARGRRPRPRRGTAPTPDANSNTGDNTNTTPPM